MSSVTTGRVVITGAGGYLGGRLAAALRQSGALGERGVDVIGLDRAAAELTDPRALESLNPDGVTHIVHAAAVTTFGVDRATAQAVNSGGTRHVIEFARRCLGLQRLVLLSTLYTAGTRTGDVPETRHRQTDFANNYEWSKHEAEDLVLDAGLPATIARVATIAADDDSGHVTQYNAVHNTLKLIYYGLLSLVPGDPATPVPLTTADFTAAVIAELLAAAPGVYHVTPRRIATLGELLDVAYDVFSENPSFARRRILKPIFCDRQSFADLIQGAKAMRAGPVHDALSSVAPFATQLYLPKRFHTSLTTKVEPDPLELIRATGKYLVASRWGRSAVQEVLL